jgi:hypothetical protein
MGRPRWGEKTPVYFRHVSQLLRWFPDARVVYLLRDPRGVAASHQVVDTEWADLDPGHVARSWLESVRTLESWTGDPRVRLFRYEDVVAAPSGTLEELFAFIGGDYDGDLLASRGGAEAHRENGSFAPGAPVSAAHVDKWRERLQVRDVSIVEHITGSAMETYGYQRVSTGLGVRTLTRIKVKNAHRNAARIGRALKEPREAIYRVSGRVSRRFGLDRKQG